MKTITDERILEKGYKIAGGLTNKECLEELKDFYLNVLVEDPQEGSSLDMKILNFIDGLIKDYDYAK